MAHDDLGPSDRAQARRVSNFGICGNGDANCRPGQREPESCEGLEGEEVLRSRDVPRPNPSGTSGTSSYGVVVVSARGRHRVGQ